MGYVLEALANWFGGAMLDKAPAWVIGVLFVVVIGTIAALLLL